MIGHTDYRGRDKTVLVILTVLILMGISLVGVTTLTSQIITGTRAYIMGEGHWSKAQKEGVLYLMKYITSGDEFDYRRFWEVLDVIEGDKQARITLMSDEVDKELAREGFLRGNNNPEDIDEMIWLFRYFKNMSYMEEAIGCWEEGDKKIEELKELAQEINILVEQEMVSEGEKEVYLSRLLKIDAELTEIENAFSASMRKAAGEVGNLMYWAILVLGILFLTIGGTAIISYIRHTKKMNRSLTESEARFRNVLESSRDVIYQINHETGEYEYMSPSVEQMIGYTAEELLEKGPQFIFENMHPDDAKRIREKVKEMESAAEGEVPVLNAEFRVKNKKGEYVWVSIIRSLLMDDEGKPYAVTGTVRDISDRKKNEQQIEQSLKEKETLLQEIHHRVKNNLAIVSSLLELQKEGLTEEMKDIFSESQSRIKSIALVHEKLYQSATLSEIKMAEYIDDLVETIAQSYHSDYKEITVEKNLDDMTLNIMDAVPCGLICNELINNAYKHGFKDIREGTLVVELKKKGDYINLSVADNGRGLPDDFAIDRMQSLGMTLVNTLARQLRADLEIEANEWTRFVISFTRTNNSKAG